MIKKNVDEICDGRRMKNDILGREYRENCLCLVVLCTIIMVHKGTISSYRLVGCIRLFILLGLALCFPSASVSSVFMELYMY